MLRPLHVAISNQIHHKLHIRRGAVRNPPPPPRVIRPFAVIPLPAMPWGEFGAYDMCISVVISYTECGCASTKEQISV
jgi:hypothetical protein